MRVSEILYVATALLEDEDPDLQRRVLEASEPPTGDVGNVGSRWGGSRKP